MMSVTVVLVFEKILQDIENFENIARAAALMHCPATYNYFSCCNIQRSNVLSGVEQE